MVVRSLVRILSCLAIVLMPIAGCQTPQYETNWNQLRVGMSRVEVESMLGQPSTTFTPPARQDASGANTANSSLEPHVSGDGSVGQSVSAPQARSERPVGPMRGERWQYGDTLSSFATRAVFPDEADERAWCVFFTPEGKVSGFRAPAWADAKRSREPVP